VDYGLFALLQAAGLAPVWSHALSYPVAVMVNFHLQRRFIFDLRRRVRTVFLLSMAFSALGWGLGTAALYLLLRAPGLSDAPYLAKGLVTGLLFFFNFYTKRYAFERRVFST
jgi:putative flippase GtrA